MKTKIVVKNTNVKYSDGVKGEFKIIKQSNKEFKKKYNFLEMVKRTNFKYSDGVKGEFKK